MNTHRARADLHFIAGVKIKMNIIAANGSLVVSSMAFMYMYTKCCVHGHARMFWKSNSSTFMAVACLGHFVNIVGLCSTTPRNMLKITLCAHDIHNWAKLINVYHQWCSSWHPRSCSAGNFKRMRALCTSMTHISVIVTWWLLCGMQN